MSFHLRFPHFRHKRRPRTIVAPGGKVYTYQPSRDTYKADDNSLLDYAVIAAVLSNNSGHGHRTSEDSFSLSPSINDSPAPDFSPGGGETSGAGSTDTFAAPEPSEPASESPAADIGGDSGGGDGGGSSD